MGPRFRVSPERLEKPGIEPTTPDLEGEQREKGKNIENSSYDLTCTTCD